MSKKVSLLFLRSILISTMVSMKVLAHSADVSRLMQSATADQNKGLVVYAVLYETTNAIAYAFTQKTGIPVHLVNMRGSGAALVRIYYEKQKGYGDIWFGGSLGEHIQAGKDGFLEPYLPKGIEQSDSFWGGSYMNNTVTGLYGGLLGIIVNTKYLEQRNVPIPRSWKDLTKPIYRNMIGMKSPVVSGTAFTTMMTLISLLGEEAAFDYLKKIHLNVKHYGNKQTDFVKTGQIGIVMSFFHEFYDTPYPEAIELIIPEEGLGYEVGGISIIKRQSTNRSNAKKFIDFAVSKIGQQLFLTNGNSRLPSNKTLFTQAIDPKYKDAKMIKIDFEWAGKNRNRLVKRWLKEVKIIKK
ncbi:extracellular solute-binding protein [Zooshikella harenae]|uniref:Extracellular solute-binding protein n=1 Tax=Zooshikella harenae TaxID=2827238 RepID=A0ABS5ZC99_9GAMM|nr:extracellular solute-binding protein [Zooshikella harenae]MBU2710941.1 extracellular solute-binding protein [Zooshikella harenae]